MEFPLLSDVLGAESPVTELQRSGSLGSVPRVSCRPCLHMSRGGWAARPGCFSVSWGCVPPASPFCLQPPSVSIWAGRGSCWVLTAVGSAQVLGLWSLAGPGAVLSPPVLGSTQLPLAQPVVRSAGLGPLPVWWGRASPPSWVSAPLLPGGLGVPTLSVPHLSPAQAPAVAWGRSWGVGEGQCRWSPEAALEDAMLNCLQGCVLVSPASWG